MRKFYYHNNYPLNRSLCRETKESWDEVYLKSILLLTYHIPGFKLSTGAPDADAVSHDCGMLVKPNLIEFLNATGGETQIIETLVPEDNDGVLIIYFNSLFNCTLEQLDEILNYQGHVLIDDTFEPHLNRVVVTKEWLEHLGYDLSNVTLWTNVPEYDNHIDIDSRVIRHNWLHLSEYFKCSGSVIKEIEDKESLKSFDNKNKFFLYMNGHCTHQRAFILGSNIRQGIQSNDMLLSYRTEIINYRQYLLGAGIDDFFNTSYKVWENRELKGDTDAKVTIRDRFKQDWWWQNSFLNINVETNMHYRNHKGRFISEKWMKGILYFTPNFNIGDYHGLEKYQTTLGFDNYSDIFSKRYDDEVSWFDRGRMFSIDLISAKDVVQDPDVWNKCMHIADYNYNHFHNKYIPELIKLFYETLEKVVDKS